MITRCAGCATRPDDLDGGALTPAGEQFSYSRCFDGDPPLGIQTCVEKYDLVQYAVFHPASHHWPIQIMETGLLLVGTAVLTVVAFRLLRRRLP